MPYTRPLVLLLALTAIAPALDTAAPSLVALAETVPICDDDHARIVLRLPAAIPIADRRADAIVVLHRAGGAWTAVAVQCGDLQARGDASGLGYRAGRLQGSLALTVRRPAARNRPEVPETTVRFALDMQAFPLPAGVVRGDDMPEDAERRFWRDFPEAQGARLRLAGQAVPVDGGGPLVVDGHVGPAELPGRWNMGRLVDGRMAFDVDLGTQRRNWNFARLAVLPFARPLDLAGAGGLRVRLTTAAPREDVEVSVWLREEDGSWYYWRSAVPLVAAEATAELRFADLAEAEWVAPGSHSDEDYVVDLRAVSHVAIGVIDPFGRGVVSFSPAGLEALPPPPPPAAPARVEVDGRLLAVNRHDRVPVGIFGGFAGPLPQEYRPGSQRRLYAGRYPWIPAQEWVQIAPEQIADADRVRRILLGQEAAAAAIGRHLAQRLDTLERERTAAGRGRFRPVAERLARFDPAKAAKTVAELLRPLLRDRALWDTDAFAGLAVAAADAAPPAADATDTAVMQRNRRLLEAALAPSLAVRGPGPSEAFFVDCLGERFEPAYLLNRDDWQTFFADFGREYATHARREGSRTILEFWNEPYLNWAERSRRNYQLDFYRVDLAGEDRPVRIRRKDGSTDDADIVPHLAWRRLPDGGWQVHDPTAFSYWSGRGNGWIYDRMFAAFAASAKAAWPEVRLSAGWGFRWNEDHWAAWDILYKPTIDRGIAWIDCVHEHHYQGDTRAMQGGYEVLTAYGVTAHGKWLHAINTETNDLVDAPARGVVDTPEKARAATGYRRLCYNLRDLIGNVAHSPDKIQARALIHAEHTPEASRAVFDVLRELRGRLVQARSDDRDVWVASSIDGTDPDAPGAAPGRTLVAVVWNDHREPRAIDLALAAPTGTTFAGPARLVRPVVDPATFAIALERSTRPVEPGAARIALTLPERGALAVAIPLAGEPGTAVEVARHQRFAPDLLAQVRRDAPLATRVVLEPALLARAQRAWLRLVLEEAAPGEGEVAVNGHVLPLPDAVTADNICLIREVPLDPALLTADTALGFRVRPDQRGYRVCMASIVVETEGE